MVTSSTSNPIESTSDRRSSTSLPAVDTASLSFSSNSSTAKRVDYAEDNNAETLLQQDPDHQKQQQLTSNDLPYSTLPSASSHLDPSRITTTTITAIPNPQYPASAVSATMPGASGASASPFAHNDPELQNAEIPEPPLEDFPIVAPQPSVRHSIHATTSTTHATAADLKALYSSVIPSRSSSDPQSQSIVKDQHKKQVSQFSNTQYYGLPTSQEAADAVNSPTYAHLDLHSSAGTTASAWSPLAQKSAPLQQQTIHSSETSNKAFGNDTKIEHDQELDAASGDSNKDDAIEQGEDNDTKDVQYPIVYKSALPYTEVRDYGYPETHPFHYGVPPPPPPENDSYSEDDGNYYTSSGGYYDQPYSRSTNDTSNNDYYNTYDSYDNTSYPPNHTEQDFNYNDPNNSAYYSHLGLHGEPNEEESYPDSYRMDGGPPWREDPDLASPVVTMHSVGDRISREFEFSVASADEIHGRAVALFDFVPENDNEAPLRVGQVIWVSYRHGQGWLVAEDPTTGETGLVPEEYVRMLPAHSSQDVATTMPMEDHTVEIDTSTAPEEITVHEESPIENKSDHEDEEQDTKAGPISSNDNAEQESGIGLDSKIEKSEE